MSWLTLAKGYYTWNLTGNEDYLRERYFYKCSHQLQLWV